MLRQHTWIILAVVTLLPTSSNQKKEEDPYVQKQGTYKTKEEIQKAPTNDHPCNLTRTSVKISFPELKSETFINLLGYKEPNLVYLWRCRGNCEGGSSPIACMATRTSQKTVTMMFKTHLTKQDSKGLIVGKEKMKEMVLEEDVECGCQCSGISASQCAGAFNEATCECECEESKLLEEKQRCLGRAGSYWDQRFCRCRSKSVSPRGVGDPQQLGCGGQQTGLDDGLYDVREVSALSVASYVILGCCLTAAAFLAITTAHYRRKLKRILREGTEEVEVGAPPSGRHKQRAVWRHPGNRANGRSPARDRSAKDHHAEFEVGGEGDMYQDQYDSQGVLVPQEEAALTHEYTR